MKRFLVVVGVLTTIGSLGWAAPTQASPITYTETSIASGTLGGTPFTDALVTVTLVGDTSDVFQVIPGLFGNIGTPTLNIAGLGSATFNDPNGYVAYAGPAGDADATFPFFIIAQASVPGGAATGNVTHILGIEDNSLTGYDLQSSFGPLTATGFGVVHGESYSTSAGLLVFDIDGGGDPVTFTAEVSPVPEPSSLSLLAVGSFGALGARRRRQRRNS
jgi:hypothetical protein